MRAKNKTREARLCWESFDCEGIVRVTHKASKQTRTRDAQSAQMRLPALRLRVIDETCDRYHRCNLLYGVCVSVCYTWDVSL